MPLRSIGLESKVRGAGTHWGWGAGGARGSLVGADHSVSAAFLGTRRAAPRMPLLPRVSSACGGGRRCGGRAAPF